MFEELRGRTAIVTGASSGIGRATARALAAQGANVVLFSRSKEKLASLAAEQPELMHAVGGDVGDEKAVDQLFRETERRFADCDLLVNNAGWIEPKEAVAMSPKEWDRHFAVNIRGVFLTTRRALPAMMHRRAGTIVNVASISGVPGPQKFPGFTAYCASKAAVISFTESLAVEVEKFGVRVNCISPGSVDTPMLRRVAPGLEPHISPEEMAQMVLFLATSASRPMNGQNLHAWGA